jgi:hypothetical protein
MHTQNRTADTPKELTNNGNFALCLGFLNKNEIMKLETKMVLYININKRMN